MSTADNMNTFIFSFISDLAKFHDIALMLIAVVIKRYGCGSVH
jgi:hypothetical protein